MFCVVTTTIKDPSDRPVPGAVVYFTIDRGTYTEDAQYPRASVRVVADGAGRISADLWVDSTGLVTTNWVVRFESGGNWRFSIPPGIPTATLEYLLGLVATPPDQSIAAAIAIHNADPFAHPGLGGGGGGLALVTLVYSIAGTYALPIAPVDPAALQLFINGAKQRYGADYNIVGTVLNWISPNPSLSTTDTIEAYL